jgi:tetratricopeptide (TPR) repeat protein
MTKGQLYTDSVRQAIVLLLPEERSLLAKLLGTSGINKKEANQFVELGNLMKEQKYAEWLEKYAKLPDKLKNSRILLLTRILAAVATGDESEYRLSLKDLHDKMGDDPTLSLILIDYYFYENDFESAQKALDNLSEHIGGDASIDALKANIYLTAEDYTRSIKYAKKAIEQEAGYEDSCWTLMNAGIFGKKYETAVTAMEKLESDFGYEIIPEEFENTEEYKEFSKSKAYKKWKEQRSSGGK